MTRSELIAALEGAEEGSRELDAGISVAINEYLPKPMGGCLAYLKLPNTADECAAGTYWLVQRSGMSLRTAPAYTTNIDAALTLVPEGHCLYQITNKLDGTYKCELYKSIEPPNKYGEAWEFGSHLRDEAATPALAICIAALKAHE